MKIVVDKMPKEAKDCLFVIYDDIFHHCFCTISKHTKDGYYVDCMLGVGDKCPYLVEIK